MKVKLIYREGSSYFGGQNPYCEDWNTIIEVNGKYYKIHSWGNHTNSGRRINEIEFDSTKIPEEYSRIESDKYVHGAGTKYSLEHGNGIIMEVNLLDFDTEYSGENLPESLRDEYKKEFKEYARKNLYEEMEKKPELNYNEIIKNAELTDEEKENAKLVIDEIEEELLCDKYLELSDFRKVIESLILIAKRKAVIIAHTNEYYSEPEDRLITLEDLKDPERYVTIADSGEHLDYAWGVRDTKPEILPVSGRKVKIKTKRGDRYYLGTYGDLDFFEEDGGMYMSGPYSLRDYDFTFYRFSICTGKEEHYKDENDEIRQKKVYFKRVIKKTKQRFDLSNQQAKVLLQFAGYVSALDLAVKFDEEGITTEQAVKILKQNNYEQVQQLFEKMGLECPEVRLDVFGRAAETLAYIHTLQKKDVQSYSAKQIGETINPRQGELDSMMKVMINKAQTKDDKTSIKSEGSNPGGDKR